MLEWNVWKVVLNERFIGRILALFVNKRAKLDNILKLRYRPVYPTTVLEVSKMTVVNAPIQVR